MENTNDFEIGEAVVVEVEGIREGSPVVRSVLRIHTRQSPEGTHCAEFDEVNRAELIDMIIDERSSERLALHVFYCCDLCNPGYDVVFEQIAMVEGLDTEELDEPWFRLATEEEKQERSAAVPAGFAAYTIALAPDSPAPRQDIFVVAKSVKVLARGRPDDVAG